MYVCGSDWFTHYGPVRHWVNCKSTSHHPPSNHPVSATAHHMFYFQIFTTQQLLVHKAVISCQLTCNILLQLLPDLCHKSISAPALRGCSVSRQSHNARGMPGAEQTHFIKISRRLFIQIYSCSCIMHWK